MRLIFASVFGVILSQTCDDIESTDEFQTIGNAVAGKKCDSNANGTCAIECKNNFGFGDKIEPVATCSCDGNCTWSYGDFGTGDGAMLPDFNCCRSVDQKQKSALFKKRKKLTMGKAYVEGDASEALVMYKIKAPKGKNAEREAERAIKNGYSVLLTFEVQLPEDVSFETFVRMEAPSVYNEGDRTHVMFKSKAGFDKLKGGESFFLAFKMKSTGDTDVSEFLSKNDAEIKFYKDRHDCYCAGNEDVCATATKTTFASFNIQVFGASKYSKTLVKDQIVTILRRYDISTIQEIRESSGESFPKLVADMNAQEDIYDFHVGERQGRSSSKEQVGFIWNKNMFTMVAGYDYDDVADDFERPPSVLVLERVGSGFSTSKFIIISAHIKPVDGASDMETEEEINKLKDVYNDALAKHSDVTNVIITGDFNADCDYVQSPTDLTLFTDADSTWLIDFEQDTTVSATDCAYDHIVVYGDTMPASAEAAGVFNFQEFYGTDAILDDEGEAITDQISDHYPVEFSFS